VDAHPEIACPAETDIAVLLNLYVRSASTLVGRDLEGRDHPIARGRTMADDLMATCLHGTGKSRWCDKSLSNVFHLDLLSTTWPDARFLLLHRHCMDFVASALEASPWGLTDYGFAQVAQMLPTDPVGALAAYWVDRTSRMLDFEHRLPERGLRVRYEDLVTRADEVMGEVWALLGVEPIADVAREAFASQHSTIGPADYKVWYTDALHADSIGSGARIPPERVAGPLRETVNGLLGQLGYPLVDDAWGSGAGTVTKLGSGRIAHDATTAEVRILRGHDVRWRGVVDMETGAWSEPEPRTATSELVVVVETDILEAVCKGAHNIGAAMRARSIRTYGPLLAGFDDEWRILDRLTTHLATKAREVGLV